jgi:hypothetical protein
VDGAERRCDEVFTRARGDRGLLRNQRAEILVSDTSRSGGEQEGGKAEGR